MRENSAMSHSIFPENFSFQSEGRDLKILAQEKIVLPVRKERVHFSIPWENLEEVDHLEKAKVLILRVRNPRDSQTILSQGKKIQKKLSSSEKEGEIKYALLEEAYPLSLAKLKERLVLYKDRKTGPSHREVYRRRGSLIPLLLSLLSLGSAVLLTQQTLPT